MNGQQPDAVVMPGGVVPFADENVTIMIYGLTDEGNQISLEASCNHCDHSERDNFSITPAPSPDEVRAAAEKSAREMADHLRDAHGLVQA